MDAGRALTGRERAGINGGARRGVRGGPHTVVVACHAGTHQHAPTRTARTRAHFAAPAASSTCKRTGAEGDDGLFAGADRCNNAMRGNGILVGDLELVQHPSHDGCSVGQIVHQLRRLVKIPPHGDDPLCHCGRLQLRSAAARGRIQRGSAASAPAALLLAFFIAATRRAVHFASNAHETP